MLTRKLAEKSKELHELEIKYLHQTGIIENFRNKEFKYSFLKKRLKTFKYLCGLSVEQFDLVKDCAAPYTHLMPYPDCPNTGEKSVDLDTQLLIVLTICRHSLDYSFMAFMLSKSITTVHRIFEGWVIFLATLFNELELKPDEGFLIKKMPKIFVATGAWFN